MEPNLKLKVDIEVLKICLTIVPDDRIGDAIEEYGEYFRFGSMDQEHKLHMMGISSPEINCCKCVIDLELVRRNEDRQKYQDLAIQINKTKLAMFVLECGIVYDGVTVVNEKNT